MQLHAFDLKGRLVTAGQALKQTDYICLECQHVVRLRGGPQRQRHFYHLEPTIFCRQHQKGPVHLQLQAYFLQQLPLGDCSLELAFPSLRRIADVAWLSQKIIFEIQYSPISAEEVLARNQDYQHMGWRVIWILHDHRYNQVRLSAAEIALHSYPHFFSNMNPVGVGMIYDQFDLCDQGVRLKRLAPLPIDLKQLPTLYPSEISTCPLVCLRQRAMHWKDSLSGDLLSLFWNYPHSSYLKQALDIEQRFYAASQPWTWSSLPAKIWQRGIAIPYQTFFRFVLERMCR